LLSSLSLLFGSLLRSLFFSFPSCSLFCSPLSLLFSSLLSSFFCSSLSGSFLFLLNPTDEQQEVTLKKAGTDLLGGMTYQAGEKVVLPAKAVAIVQSR